MGNDSRLVKDQHQKNIVKLFSRFDGSKNRRKVFEDFVTASAIAISNSCDETHAEEREEHLPEPKQVIHFERLAPPELCES